jgi:hypothetical protein
MSSIVVGRRTGYGKEHFSPHNILVSVLGASLLWVGWFGFNAGSYFGATALAANAMAVTQISTAMSTLSWMLTEWMVKKRPSVLGIISGTIAGLVAITPAAGSVDSTGAFFIGLLAGPVCFCAAQAKHRFGYDDALDAFGIHGPGGILGGILTGVFATEKVTGEGSGFKGCLYGGWTQLGLQIYGCLVAIVWSCVVSWILLKFIDCIWGLRVAIEDELIGLDIVCHGENLFALHDLQNDLTFSNVPYDEPHQHLGLSRKSFESRGRGSPSRSKSPQRVPPLPTSMQVPAIAFNRQLDRQAWERSMGLPLDTSIKSYGGADQMQAGIPGLPYVVHPAFDPSGLGPWGNDESRSASRGASDFEGRAPYGMDATNFSRVDSDVSRKPRQDAPNRLDASNGSVADIVSIIADDKSDTATDPQGAATAATQVPCPCSRVHQSCKEPRPPRCPVAAPVAAPAAPLRANTRLMLLCQAKTLQAKGASDVLGGVPLQLGKAHVEWSIR